MRKPIKVVAAVVLLGAGIAACSGGGTSLPSTTPNAKPTTPGAIASVPKQNVTFSLTVPAASTSHVRSPQYIPSTTQSFKVVETDNGGTPNPPVIQNTAAGSPNCTTNSTGTSCTVSIAANIGNDSFTVSAYDGANATGNLLASGTVLGTVAAGVANSFPLTLNGQVASVTLGASDAYPQVGTPTTLYVQAKDATGNTIIGTYNAPVSLTSNGTATITPNSVSTSSSAPITIAASTTQLTPYTVTASFNDSTSRLNISPSSGIVSYNIGSSSFDGTGFGMLAGNDGNFYYTTLGGTQTCSNGFCSYTGGNVGQFNPNTGASSELTLPGSGAVDMYQTTDGTLWVPAPTGTSTGAVVRIAGGFSAGNMTQISLPPPLKGSSSPRAITLGSDGNLYLTGNGDHAIYQIPTTVTSTANITEIPMPKETAVPGAPYSGYTYASNPQSIASGSDGALYIGNHAFNTVSIFKYVPGGAFTDIQPPYSPQTEAPRFLVAGTDGNIYTSYNGNCSTICGGGLTSYNPTTGAITALPVPSPYSQPDHLAAGNGQIAFADLIAQGFGTYTNATNDVLIVPTQQQVDSVTQDPSVAHMPDAVAYATNGDLWYLSYGRTVVGGPLAMNHVIMTGAWSVWPSSNITLFGTGAQNSQPIGLLESGNSGPFTTTNGVCASLQPLTGTSHDFLVVGTAAGACTVSIQDNNGRVKTLSVNVTATNGTISSVGSRVGAAAHKGGSY